MTSIKRGEPYRIATIPIAGLISALLIGCGGGGDGGSDLGGTIDTTVFTLPAGQTRTVTSNLIIKATQSIDISGTMIVKPGVSVALLSDQDLNVSGAVQSETPSKAAAVTGRSRDGGEDNFILYATKTDIPGTISVDKKLFVCGKGENPTLTVTKSLTTTTGADGKNRTDNGHDGPSIEVGTANVTEALRKLGRECKDITTIDLRSGSRLEAGGGGHGFNDDNGVIAGHDVVYTATDGGKGGSVLLKADNIITNGTVRAGLGGAGGDCHKDIVASQVEDGVLPGEKGGSATMTLGNGGRGGDIAFTGVASGTLSAESGPGNGGNSGSGSPRAGDGGPAGDGGDMTIRTGAKGAPGTGPGTAPSEGAAGSVGATGGDGGDSEDPAKPGGKGGTLTISEKSGGPLTLGAGSGITNGLDGGFGFNGCGIVPQVKGTNGGNGGNIDCPVAIMVNGSSMTGGDGGDGTQIGAGGTGGFRGITKVGTDGKPGELCTYTPPAGTPAGFLAVSLDHKLDIKIGGIKYAGLAPGDIVPLCRIHYGHISGPEPVVPAEDRGCVSMHLHKKAAVTGIRIRTHLKILGPPAIWLNVGPFLDESPTTCGYGKLVIMQECKIITKDDNVK